MCSTTRRARRDRPPSRAASGAGPCPGRKRTALRGGGDEPRPRDLRVRRLRAGRKAPLAVGGDGPLRIARAARRGLQAARARPLLPGAQGRGVQRLSRVPLPRTRRGARPLLLPARGGLLLRLGEERGGEEPGAAARAETCRTG